MRDNCDQSYSSSLANGSERRAVDDLEHLGQPPTSNGKLSNAMYGMQDDSKYLPRGGLGPAGYEMLRGGNYPPQYMNHHRYTEYRDGDGFGEYGEPSTVHEVAHRINEIRMGGRGGGG
eukprot:CAMPEP_0113661988 /NCGR_PEP_ID=MMETSP0038_2-20120614/306_1 /TAXON_ID=2898 /ORGANISM="Cryptomonas paramecium" /LENGTH=117 /DNA_ID=CAMNT_0000576793 /DNA_START=267 /DNA_END=617 /DNA_ORIENTATION=+ /assembly_acc=CAM_ASM_000170